MPFTNGLIPGIINHVDLHKLSSFSFLGCVTNLTDHLFIFVFLCAFAVSGNVMFVLFLKCIRIVRNKIKQ